MRSHYGSYCENLTVPLAKSTVSMLLVIALYGCSDAQETQPELGRASVPTAILPPNSTAEGAAVKFTSTTDESFRGIVEHQGKATISWTPTEANVYEVYRRALPSSAEIQGRNRNAAFDVCADTIFEDGSGNGSIIPIGYDLVATVDDNGFIDTGIEDPGLYRYIVIGVDAGSNKELVAQDLTLQVISISSAESSEPDTEQTGEVETQDPSTGESEPSTGAASPEPGEATSVEPVANVGDVNPFEPVVESPAEPEPAPEPVAESPSEPEPAPEPVAESPSESEPALEPVAESPSEPEPAPAPEPDSEPVAESPDAVAGGVSVEETPTDIPETDIPEEVEATGAGSDAPAAAAPSSVCEPPVGEPVPGEAVADIGRDSLDPVNKEDAPEPGDSQGAPTSEPVVVVPPSGPDGNGGSGSDDDAPTRGPDGRLLAFPGATGFGRYSTGGRGGKVVVVDTRADVVDANDGRTSLREALDVISGPRTIVFSVGGVFDTSSKVILMANEQGSNVTVACQTAPSPGVIIKGRGIRIKGAHDVIMRHCVIRNIDPGHPDAESNRTIGIVGTSAPNRDMIFDHMSLSWATDENFTVFTGPTSKGDSTNFTLSHSIVSEGDADSAHPESGQLPARYLHAMGPSCGSSSTKYRINGCSMLSNYIAHNGRRNPLMWGISGEFVNNIVYNWHETATDARPHFNKLLEVYVVGNEYKAGPTSKEGNSPLKVFGEQSSASLVVRDNVELAYPGGARKAHANKTVASMPFAMSQTTPVDLDCVGATRPMRDAIDVRVVNDYLNGTGSVGIFFDQRRDYSIYQNSEHGAQYDTDKDGMADSWELANGLDTNDSEDYRRDRDDDGFTNLEEFINDQARCLR